MRPRPLRVSLALGLAGLVGLAGTLPAGAVSDPHDGRVVSADPANTTPHVMDGAVLAITQVGSRVVVAGSFSSVSPAGTFRDASDDVTRNGIFAFDATTGAIDSGFDPDLGGQARSLDTDGTHIYVGGQFTSVGGDGAIKRVAKLTAGGDVVPGFVAVPNAEVTEVVVRGTRLYVGGFFTRITTPAGASQRGAMAALHAGTGAVLADFDIPFTGRYDSATVNGGGMTSIKRFDVTPDGSRLAAIGNFDTVGGRPRSQVAVLNTARRPATVAQWKTDRYDTSRNNCLGNFNTFTRDIDFSPDGSWFVVSTTAGWSGGARAGTMCDTVSRWQTRSTGNDPRWVDYNGGDTAWGLEVTDGAVYVGGHMRWQNNPFRADQPGPGAVHRPGIAALDPVNGLPLSWNPGRTLGVGAQALFATGQGLWVGSDTVEIGGETHGRLAFMPLAGGIAVPSVPSATLPNDIFVAKPRSPRGVLLRRPVGAAGAPAGRLRWANAAINWSRVRGAFLVNDTMYYGWRNGRMYRRTFDPATGALGPRSQVDLRPAPDGTPIPLFPVTRITGMFFDANRHRLYYTVRDNPRLFYRYFTPESDVVGAQPFVARRKGVSFAAARGMTLASGNIVYGSKSGRLRKVRFAGGHVASRPVGLGPDRRWNARALMVSNQ